MFCKLQGLILIILIQLAASWWQNGHMMTSLIAKNELMKKNMTIYNRVEELVAAFNSLTDGCSNEMVSAAVWADDIKQPGMNFMDNYHFYNRPSNPSNLYLMQNLTLQQENSVDILRRASLVLANDTGSNNVPKAMMLRYALHVVGDIHQPLHSVAMFNRTYMQGDQGGNLLNITTVNGQKMNLHGFWDSGALYLQPSDDLIIRPLNVTGVMFMQAWALELLNQYPRSSFTDRLTNQDPFQWTTESWNIANNIAYPPFTSTSVMNQTYQNMAEEIVKQQIVLGGYRLCDFLLNVFSTYNPNPISQNPQ